MTLEDQLEPCTCEEGDASAAEPAPGRRHLALRPTPHGESLARMLDALSTMEIPDGANAGQMPLRRLTSRDRHDPAIALLDATAAVLDVLSVYHERNGNEHYLSTATEVVSLRAMANGVGYAPAPAVSAVTTLAFSVRADADGSGRALVPAGTQVTNLSTDGSAPLVFETATDLLATAERNALRPRQLRRFAFATDSTTEDEDGETIFVARLLGTALGVRSGMRLLVRESELVWDVWEIDGVEEVSAANETILQLNRAVTFPDGSAPTEAAKVFVLRNVFQSFGAAAPEWAAMPKRWRREYAPDAWEESDWPNLNGAVFANAGVALLPESQDIVQGSWLHVYDATTGGYAGLLRVGAVRHLQKTGFGMTARTTRAAVSRAWKQKSGVACSEIAPADLDEVFWTRRNLTLYGDSKLVTLAFVTDDAALAETSSIALDGIVTGIELGTAFMLSDGASSERVVVRKITVDADETYSILKLKATLVNSYDRQTAYLYGNLVPASHGERVVEALGSGDPHAANQAFTLAQAPLAHMPSKDEERAESTLRVRVGGRAWHCVPSFLGVSGDAHAYTARVQLDGSVRVEFGDGRHGSRLPAGVANVVAHYRKGGGALGNLPAGQLTQLRGQVPMISGVFNVTPAVSGTDAERIAELRRQVPRATLSLGRLISLADYRDFVRAYPGLGAALLQPLVVHGRPVVLVSVLDPDGLPFDGTSEVVEGLVASLQRRGDPSLTVHVVNGVVVPFSIRAKIKPQARRGFEAAEASCQRMLARRFGFGGVGFGEHVSGAGILAALHDVRAVEAVDLDRVWRTSAGQHLPGRSTILRAREGAVRRKDQAILPAQMLSLQSAVLVEMPR